jgi:iron complex outermembrane receptor protein
MRSSLRACACIMLLSACPVFAQADSAQQRDTAYLPPTVITVLRTAIDQSRAPFAVGVATREDIQRAKPGLALDEALQGIAGVQVDNRFNYALGERISIRGFGARAQFGVRGIRVLLDGIPMTLADGQTSLNNIDVGTLARAEVVRGPASSIYGNATGGVVQLRTDDLDEASLRRVGGDARLSLGADGLARYQIGTRIPVPGAGVSVTASRLSYDGYRAWNDARNDHVNFKVTPFTSLGDISIAGNWVNYSAHNPGGLSNVLLAANRTQAFANNVAKKTGEEGRQGQVGATWSRTIGGIEANVSGFGLTRHIDNPIPNVIVVIDRRASGGRVSLGATPHLGARGIRLAAGAERQLQNDDRRNFLNVAGTRGADTLDQRERVTNDALFTQASVDVLPRLLLLVGARYDRVLFRADDHLVSTGNPDDSGDRTMSAASPSVGVTWTASRMLDVYTNYSASFETPTTSELGNRESGAGGLNPSLEPQRTRSVEVGANGRVLVGAVRGSYQVAMYRARVRDALIPFEVATAPGRQYFRNAGSTQHRGVETSTSLVFPWHLFLRSAFTYTDARFVNYAVTSGATTTVYDGRRVPGVAHNRGDATLSFQPARLFFDWDARASSSIPVNDANSERSPSYVIHGARAGVRDVRVGDLAFAPHIGVLNLFDRAYNTSVVVNAFGGRYYEPGPPRSLYAGIDARF